jgi:hypothetical protein
VSEWCILAASVAERLGYEPDPLGWVLPLHSRFGRVEGCIERIPVRFRSTDGATVEVQATWFVSADWPGPTVIGWKGCLERLRFAFDPNLDWLYFGEL